MDASKQPSEFDYLSSEMQERIIFLEKQAEDIKRERVAWQRLFSIIQESEMQKIDIIEAYSKVIIYALTMDHRSAHDVAELEYLAKKAGLEGK